MIRSIPTFIHPSQRVVRLRLGHLLLACFLRATLAAEMSDPVALSPLVVTATRVPQAAAHLPVTVDVFRADDLHSTPSLMLDEVLKASAGFSLFRRTGSLMANPTAQGVSLRNIGPSGAGRTLVLLDGVPLNDPFGGWVAWTKLPRLTLAGAEIVRGGGSSAWGSAALGGTVQFLSTAPDGPTHARLADSLATQALVELGDFSTRSAEVLTSGRAGAHRLEVAARTFATDGFWRVGAADRGSIDRRTDSDHQLAQLRWHHASSAGTTSGITARFYQEDRGNGTPLQRNRSRETFVAGHTRGRWADAADWAATAYFQSQKFSNLFTSVSGDRSSETPALDQFAVPADAAGAAFTTNWGTGDRATTTAGVDFRWVDGETQEAFFLQEGQFARQRFAGGSQHFLGAFVQHQRAWSDNWRVQLGARTDYWQNRNGHRREVEQATGVSLRDDRFAPRDGWEFSPGGGLVWSPNQQTRFRTAAYRAFRVPTLNELYRPFRVGNVITEANAALAVETLDGIEAGFEITRDAVTFAATGFVNELRNAVANVTLGRGPGVIPGVGFVPVGGVGRQRRNLEVVRIQGFELTGRWRMAPTADLRVDYLYSDARVDRAGPVPDQNLVGRRLAQVPLHTLVAGLEWRPAENWRLGVQLRHVSEAFEDDMNELSLAPASTVDIRIAHTIGGTRAGEIFLAVENLGNETVVAGRDADGRRDLGSLRFAHGGVRWHW